MYTLAQIELASAAIHNQANETALSEARMKAVTAIYLAMLSAGHTQVEKESLTEAEIALIDHFLKEVKA